MPKLTAARLREVLDYNLQTGLFRWKSRNDWLPRLNTRYAGTAAGTLLSDARNTHHVQIGLDGEKHSAHRLAWLWMTGSWPAAEIDHRDGDGTNNRWANLREATRAQNAHNASRYSNNTSGFKGVTFDKARGLWRAVIRIDGKDIRLGRFKTAQEAGAAYREAAEEHRGEFAFHRRAHRP